MHGTRENFRRGCNTNAHLAYLPDSLVAFANLSFYWWDALRLASIMNHSLVWRLGKGPTSIKRPSHVLVSWFEGSLNMVLFMPLHPLLGVYDKLAPSLLLTTPRCMLAFIMSTSRDSKVSEAEWERFKEIFGPCGRHTPSQR
jgi:hypothetical protein